MSLSKYLAFVVTADLHNLTRAADKLGYTQSGVSHLINALETELGIPLLTRSKSGTVLTPEGAPCCPMSGGFWSWRMTSAALPWICRA